MTSDPRTGARTGPSADERGGVTRRRLLAIGGLGGFGAAGLGSAACTPSGTAAGGAAADCVLTAQQTAGPYHLDLGMVRQDITEGKSGAPLRLRVTVVDAGTCAPIAGAAVEIWHCDATGYYSGFTDRHPGGSPPPEDGVGDARTFLRGGQIAGADGTVDFQTIIPGWYAPRAVHIHTKVHVGGTRRGGRYRGGRTVHTGQFYFPDDVVTEAHARPPYSTHRGKLILLGDDSIYAGGGAREGLLAVSRAGGGYEGSIRVGVDGSAGADE